jgi:hypothetical protein
VTVELDVSSSQALGEDVDVRVIVSVIVSV